MQQPDRPVQRDLRRLDQRHLAAHSAQAGQVAARGQPTAVDRDFRAVSGLLHAVAGIAIGKLTGDGGGADPTRLPTETVLSELLADLGVPVLLGLTFGHVPDITTLPCGVLAELDADAGTLSLLEPAVT